LSNGFTSIKTKKEREDKEKEVVDLLKYWPKIVDYTGLSEYEAKVYLSLLVMGTSGARKLSLNCEVPRTKVYGTLRKLIDNGLAVEIPGSPKKFSPANPEDSFNTLLTVVKNRAIEFNSVVETLTETHQRSKVRSYPKKKIIWYIDGEEETEEKCMEIIRKSKKSLTILTNKGGLGLLFNSAHRLLDEIHERGIQVSLYSPLDPGTSSLARELSYIVQVRKVDFGAQIIFINSDDEKFLVARISSQENNMYRFEDAFFSKDEVLLSILSEAFFNSNGLEEPG
jgi:sugar-specific transcriptional regulator TrmB